MHATTRVLCSWACARAAAAAAARAHLDRLLGLEEEHEVLHLRTEAVGLKSHSACKVTSTVGRERGGGPVNFRPGRGAPRATLPARRALPAPAPRDPGFVKRLRRPCSLPPRQHPAAPPAPAAPTRLTRSLDCARRSAPPRKGFVRSPHRSAGDFQLQPASQGGTRLVCRERLVELLVQRRILPRVLLAPRVRRRGRARMPAGGPGASARAAPPPTVAPTRVPTVHSNPPSLAGGGSLRESSAKTRKLLRPKT